MVIHVLMINEQSTSSDSINDLLSKEFRVHNFSAESGILDSKLADQLDVIIIDTSNPYQNNMIWCEHIRKLSQAPILVMSNTNQPGIVEKVLDSGADDFILKPVSPALLRSRVKALARRSVRVI
ncbi:MAG: response regulator [Chloroflexota bacterium]